MIFWYTMSAVSLPLLDALFAAPALPIANLTDTTTRATANTTFKSLDAFIIFITIKFYFTKLSDWLYFSSVPIGHTKRQYGLITTNESRKNAMAITSVTHDAVRKRKAENGS